MATLAGGLKSSADREAEQACPVLSKTTEPRPKKAKQSSGCASLVEIIAPRKIYQCFVTI